MGHYPFEAQNEGALIRKILRGQYTPPSGPYTSSLLQAVTALLTFKPQNRPDTTSLLRNPSLLAKVSGPCGWLPDFVNRTSVVAAY